MNAVRLRLVHEVVDKREPVGFADGWVWLILRCGLKTKHHPTARNRESPNLVNCMACMTTAGNWVRTVRQSDPMNCARCGYSYATHRGDIERCPDSGTGRYKTKEGDDDEE